MLKSPSRIYFSEIHAVYYTEVRFLVFKYQINLTFIIYIISNNFVIAHKRDLGLQYPEINFFFFYWIYKPV